MVDIVEAFSSMEYMPENLPGEDINPNPVFTTEDRDMGLNIVPPVPNSNDGLTFHIPTRNRFVPTKSPIVGDVVRTALNEVESFVKKEGYDLKVVDEMDFDHALGFCLGSMRTHVTQFSHKKTRNHLLEIIHYAAMALHVMDQEPVL